MKHTNLLGIDISEDSIKVLQLDADNTAVAYESAALPTGVIKQGSIQVVETFSEVLNRALSKVTHSSFSDEEQAFNVILCLPESKLFSHHCVVPEKSDESYIKALVHDDAQKIVPFNLDDLYWNYHVAEEGGVNNATFIGVAKTDLDNYIRSFKYAKVKPTFVVGELFALGRSLLPNPPLTEDYLILDIGAHSTTIGAFSIDAIPNMSVIVQQGGKHFTRHVAEWLGVTVEEAEQQKRQYGVDPAHEETRVPAILRESLSPLISDVVEAKEYFEQKTGNPIKHIVVAGGSALLPHIDSFISEKVGVETSIADPMQKIKGKELVNDKTPEVFLANVIGLALSENNSDFSHLNLLTQYERDEMNIDTEHLVTRDLRSTADVHQLLRALLKKAKTAIRSTFRVIRELFQKLDLKLVLTSLFLLVAVIFLAWVMTKYI